VLALEKIRNGELRYAAGLNGFIASLARNLVTEHFGRGTRPTTNDPAALEAIQSPEPGALDRIVAGEHVVRNRETHHHNNPRNTGRYRNQPLVRRAHVLTQGIDRRRVGWVAGWGSGSPAAYSWSKKSTRVGVAN